MQLQTGTGELGLTNLHVRPLTEGTQLIWDHPGNVDRGDFQLQKEVWRWLHVWLFFPSFSPLASPSLSRR
ncbi:hypothetical protein XI05_08080 [Bradyrhizobium sp. CCBAU 11357]|nr:hypothetical protein [Bradyrhizobium sp. CCBAU 11357]